MIIGTAEIFVILSILIVLAIIYAAYTTLKQLRTLESSQAQRILDLMFIGAILYLLDFLMPQERGGQTIILRTAGILIMIFFIIQRITVSFCL